jgi:hypothetical protein
MFEGALGRAGAHEGVKLVDEQDDPTVGVRDLPQHRLQPILELSTVLRARDERAQIERHQPFVLERQRHVAVDDALGEPFHDGRLAYPGLPDDDRVVLGPAGKNLDHAAYLVVSPDHGIELVRSRKLGQIAPIAVERLVLLLWTWVRDALAPPDVLKSADDGVLRDPGALQDLRRGAFLLPGQGDQEMLDAHVLVLEVLRLLEGRVEHGIQAPAQGDLDGA